VAASAGLLAPATPYQVATDAIMSRMKLSKLSMWDVVYAVDMAIACLITYWVMVFLLFHLVGWPTTSVGVLWALDETQSEAGQCRNQASEMALSVLSYNLTRVMNIIGIKPLIAAIAA
jgi:hypothetical protein